MTILRTSALVLLLGLVASPAFAQDAKKETKGEKAADATAAKTKEAAKEAADEEESEKKWGVSVGIRNSIGQGTFASVEGLEETDDGAEVRTVGGDPGNAYDRVSMGYSLGASYGFDLPADQSLSLSTSLAWSHWLTQGGGINGSNEIRFQDIGLSAGWGGVTIPGIDARLSGGLTLTFPTAKTSRIATKVLGTSLSARLSKTFLETISLSFGIGGGKTFHRSKGPLISQETVGAENIIFREGENGKLGNESLVHIGGINGEYSLSLSFGAGFPIVEKLRGSISYGVGTYWTYNRNNIDEFTPNQVDADGNPVIDEGRGVGQSTSAGVSLSYPLISDWNGISVSGSAGVRTGQTPKTSDNKSFNFPFWNVNGAAANRSSISLGLSGSY